VREWPVKQQYLSQFAVNVPTIMILSFSSFAVSIEATDIETNRKVDIKISGSPEGFIMSTEIKDSEESKVEATVPVAGVGNYVDLTKNKDCDSDDDD
jgi:hypothetical protein